MTRPAKENVSVVPVNLSQAPPTRPAGPEQNEQVEAEHGRRQHERQRYHGLDDRARLCE